MLKTGRTLETKRSLQALFRNMIGLAFAILSITFSGTTLAEIEHPPKERTAGAMEAAIVYYSLSGEPIPRQRMVEGLSEHGFKSEFERRRFIKENGPAFDKLVSEIRAIEYLTMLVRGSIGEYHFDRGAFPLEGLFDRMYVRRDASRVGLSGSDFAFLFRNSGDLRFLKMAPDAAESLANQMNRQRKALYGIRFVPVRAGRQTLDGRLRRVIEVHITEIVIFDRHSEAILATMEAESPPAQAQAATIEQQSDPVVREANTNPWRADDVLAVLYDRYGQLEGPSDALDILDFRTNLMRDCISDFGVSACQDMSDRRRKLFNECERRDSRFDQCNWVYYFAYDNREYQSIE